MPIRTDQMRNSCQENLQELASVSTDEDWTRIGSILWALWRSRNDCVYGGGLPTLEGFGRYFTAMHKEATLFEAGKRRGRSPPILVQGEEELTGFYCLSDGSWTDRSQGGIGYVIKNDGVLVIYRVEGVMVWSAFQAEAMAMLRAVNRVLELNITTCVFCSDNEELVHCLSAFGPPINTDWRAAKEVFSLWEIMNNNKGFQCRKILRCHNDEADHLAKSGRLGGLSYTGFTYPLFDKSM